MSEKEAGSVHHGESGDNISTSSPSADHESGYDHTYDRKLIHRVDRRLLPILGALYAIALIDRTNMSNAAVAGMTTELDMLVGDRYSIALLMFFIPYFLFELPSNIILKKVGAAEWLSAISVAWGAVMIGMGFVDDWRVLVVCRTILGFFEAGFFPGCVYIVSTWYVRYEVQKRMAGFYLCSTLLGGFSSILAYGLMQLHGRGGLSGWRWIFIVEGILTCVVGVIAYWSILDFPGKARQKSNGRFLTEAEIEYIKARVDKDRADSHADPLTAEKAKKHLCDWKLWVFALLFMCSTMASYALSYFLPIILRGMGYSTGMSQILTAPPFVFATFFGMSLAWVGDYIRMRSPIIAVQSVITIVGLILTAYAPTNAVRYFGTFLGMAGAQSNIPAVLSYQSNNIRMDSKRSVGSALQVGFGAIGGIIASTVFRQKDAPKYLNGLWATIGGQLAILLMLAITTVYFYKKNRQASRGETVIENHGDFRHTY